MTNVALRTMTGQGSRDRRVLGPHCTSLLLLQVVLTQMSSVLGLEPSFDVPIVNVTVVAGQTAVLPCSIEDLGKYKVAWLDQKNMALTFEDRPFVDDPRFSVLRPYLKEWNLQIVNVRWEDQGQYKCTINTDPGKSKSVVLHVKVPAQIIDHLSTGDVTVQEGDTVVLVCNVTGVPHPEVAWYRKPASSKSYERQSKMCHKLRTHGPGIGHAGEVIIIQNVSRYCDDTYECVADNGIPPAVSRQMTVTVEFAPEITMPNKRISQDKGKNTILECIITAYPHAVTDWEKDGHRLSSQSGKYRIQPYDDGQHTITLSLSINNITDEDYGQYRCVASNALGTDHEKMELYRTPPPKDDTPSPPPTPMTGTYIPSSSEPKPPYIITDQGDGIMRPSKYAGQGGSGSWHATSAITLALPVLAYLLQRHLAGL